MVASRRAERRRRRLGGSPAGCASVAFSFNSAVADVYEFLDETIIELGRALGAIDAWPDGDLFAAQA